MTTAPGEPGRRDPAEPRPPAGTGPATRADPGEPVGERERPAGPIRIVLADDQVLVRAGFGALLAAQPGFEVAAECADGAEAVAAVAEHAPDVVLMDIRMPRMDGIEATRRVAGTTQVLILTTFDADELVYAALRAGASGFLLKDTPPEELIRAVRVIAAGEALLAPSVTRRLISDLAMAHVPASEARDLAALTPRELDVLTLIARGLGNTEIAAKLVVSEGTVKTHVNRIMAKLGLLSRAQAVVAAYEARLVVPGSSH
ncbi:response regulator [Longispora albida]|uniref:response regulator n=1 Tax=Longispora albida TaxID=203523 RepID=UPI00037E9F2A|nr:response regulator transcription factor [Longispora albida]